MKRKHCLPLFPALISIPAVAMFRIQLGRVPTDARLYQKQLLCSYAVK
jgi:hypothetical protein